MRNTIASTILSVILASATCSSVFADGDKIIAKPPVTNGDAIISKSLTFSDVASSHWAFNQIRHLNDMGIASGVGENKFAPDKQVTKAEFVKMLIRLGYKEGALGARSYIKAPAPGQNYIKEPKAPYTDIKKTDWFYEDVVDAYNRGFLAESVAFNPSLPISREDAALIAAKYFSTVADIGLNLRGDIIQNYPFKDKEDGTLEGVNAALYLSNLGIVSGKDNGALGKVFDFKGHMTRAEAAVVIGKIDDQYKQHKKDHISYKEGDATFTVDKADGKYTIVGTLDKLPTDGYTIHIVKAEASGDNVTVHYTIAYPTKVPNDTVGTVVDTYEMPVQKETEYNFNFISDNGDGFTALKENGIDFTVAHKQDDLFITADMGERPTTGYAVKIEGIDFSSDNTITINYSYSMPKDGEMQGQMVTHPKDAFSNRVEIGVTYKYKLNLIKK